MRRLHVSICLFTIVLAAGSTCFAAEKSNLGVKISTFGKMPEGRTIELYTLTNTKGMQVAITNYGGRVVSLWAPDRNGKMGDVVLGFDDLNGYLGKNPYFGALCSGQSEEPGPAD
jgi:aldose 1-epimerase